LRSSQRRSRSPLLARAPAFAPSTPAPTVATKNSGARCCPQGLRTRRAFAPKLFAVRWPLTARHCASHALRLAPALTCAPLVSTRVCTFSKQGPHARPGCAAITKALRPTHSCPHAGVGDRQRGTPPPDLVSPARNAPPPSSLAALSRPSLAAASALAPGTPLPPSPPTPTPRFELCRQVTAPHRRHAMHPLTPRQSGWPSSFRV
jgi:hypothetical protein